MYKHVDSGRFQCRHSLNTRNRHQVVPEFHRLSLTQHAFSFTGPTVWNDIPLEIRNSPSLPAFKRKFKEYLIDLYGVEWTSRLELLHFIWKLNLNRRLTFYIFISTETPAYALYLFFSNKTYFLIYVNILSKCLG